MKKIPEEISLGPFVISVIYQDSLIAEREAYGEWSGNTLEIRIQSGMEESKTREAFFHELLEAINEFYVLNLEHSAIKILGVSLAQALEGI